MKTEILEHDIKWWVEDDSVKELDGATIEYIENCIHDGISRGQIVMTLMPMEDEDSEETSETSGWWQIVNWMDIACELRNALINGNEERSLEALKRFDENW